MQFDNLLQNVLTAVITVTRHYQRELLNLLPIGHLPVQIQQ